jgi:alcohol dehydrogenase, propanol-preferring
MRAVRLHAVNQPLRVEEVPTPVPTGPAVRIRVAGAGVCRTDLHIVDGTQPRVDLPRTLGHEVSGWVDAAGPDADLEAYQLALGDPVVVYGGWGCGTCPECGSGEDQRCERSLAPGFQADGGYADALLVPHARHLVGLGSLDPVEAAPLGDAGMTAHRAVRRAEPWLAADARVLVIGAGGVGQFVIQLLRLVSASGARLRIAVAEPNPERGEIAGMVGADVVRPTTEEALEALGGAPTVVVDVVGSDATLGAAGALIAPNGLVLLVGESGGTLGFGFSGTSIESWATTVAWGSLQDLRAVVAAASTGRLRWEVERLPLIEATLAHHRLRAGDVRGRLVLVP